MSPHTTFHELRLNVSDPQLLFNFAYSLAVVITDYISCDYSIRLSGSEIEGFIIGADSYSDIQNAVWKGLSAIFRALSQRAPLPLPMSAPFVDVCVFQLFAPMEDLRGQYLVDFNVPEAPSMSGEEVNIWRNIFGPDGYYHVLKNHRIVSDSDPYNEDGSFKDVSLIVGQGKDISKKQANGRTTAAIKTITASPNSRSILTREGDDHKSYRVQDSHPDSFVGNQFLFPALTFDPDDVRLLKNRLIGSDNPSEDYPPRVGADTLLAAARMGQFLESCSEHALALRGVLFTEANQGMAFDLQRTFTKVFASCNKRELPESITQLPNFTMLVKMLNALMILYNPYAMILQDDTFTGNEENRKAMHTYAAILKELNGTSTLAESLRAHKGRFIAYSDEGDRAGFSGFTGFTQILLTPQTEGNNFLEVNVAQLSNTSVNDPFSVNYMGFTGSGYVIQKWQDFTEMMYEMRKEVSRTSTLLVDFSPCIQTSPLISRDFNRVPISAKYGCLSIDKNNSSKSEVDEIEFNPVKKSDIEELLLCLCNFLARSNDLEYVMPFLPFLVDYQEDNYRAVQAASVGAFINYEEFNLNAIKAFADKEDLPVVVEGLEDASALLNQLSFNNENPDIQVTLMTRVREIAFAAHVVSDVIYLPVIVETDEEQLVAVNGFHTSVLQHSSKFTEIADANLLNPEDAKPKSVSGVFLNVLSKKGGFGFMNILTPLIKGVGSQAIQAVGGLASDAAAKLLEKGTTKLSSMLPE